LLNRYGPSCDWVSTGLFCVKRLLALAPQVVRTALVGAGLYCGFHFSRWYRRRVTASVRIHTRHVINDIDVHNNAVEDLAGAKHPSRMVRVRLIAAAASRDCRARFLFMSRTEANMLVAHKWLHDYISALKDMRKADVPLIVPVALELCFVPSASELVANQIRFTDEVQHRLKLYNQTWWDWGFWGGSPDPQPLVD